MLGRRVHVAQVGLVFPDEKVLRSRRPDGPHALVSAVGEVAPIRPILAARRVPEGQVLRVECAVLDDGLHAQLGLGGEPVRPADAVGRLERVEAARAVARERLVTRLGRAGWVGVLEGSEVVRHGAGGNDVVLLRSVEIKQAELGLGERQPVPALRVARELRVRLLLRRLVPMPAAVIHPEPVVVREDGVVGGGVAFPRRVAGDDHVARLGLVRLECRTVELRDEEVIEKQFATRTQGDCR